jgi:hypothetical protein
MGVLRAGSWRVVVMVAIISLGFGNEGGYLVCRFQERY